MASAMRVFSKFRSSDGRIKVATLSGVSALVAVIALLVGVLPVIATDDSFDETDKGVHPEEVEYGGGSGACDFVEVDSDAKFELHINNPANGTFEGPDGTKVKITLSETDPRIFGYEFVGEGDDPAVMAAYDVVVNGGPHNLWYDNDGQVGTLQDDGNLHAPRKNNGDLNNLSHINICYDVAPVSFVCGESEKLEGEGLITEVTAVIFANSDHDCIDKEGFFTLENDVVTLEFDGDGSDTAAGRLDFTKDFGDPSDFENLEYDGPGEFVDLQWCTVDTKDVDGVDRDDGDEFDDVLEDDEYPSLDGVEDTLSDDTTAQATACKVSEEENAAGVQLTVVYFEFEDPNFR